MEVLDVGDHVEVGEAGRIPHHQPVRVERLELRVGLRQPGAVPRVDGEVHAPVLDAHAPDDDRGMVPVALDHLLERLLRTTLRGRGHTAPAG